MPTHTISPPVSKLRLAMMTTGRRFLSVSLARSWVKTGPKCSKKLRYPPACLSFHILQTSTALRLRATASLPAVSLKSASPKSIPHAARVHAAPAAATAPGHAPPSSSKCCARSTRPTGASDNLSPMGRIRRPPDKRASFLPKWHSENCDDRSALAGVPPIGFSSRPYFEPEPKKHCE